MSRVYTITGKAMTIAGATTLLWVNPGTTASLQIIRIEVGQYGTSTPQQIGLQIGTQTTAFPTVSGVAPDPISTSDPVSKIVSGTGSAGTCGINATSEGAGTKNPFWVTAFNNQNGWAWIATPDERIVLPAGSAAGFGVMLINAPTSLTLWNASLAYQEI